MAPESLPYALEIWDNAARLALPIWLKAWLGFLALSFLASLAFVRTERTARIVLASFVASHLGLVVLGLAGVTIRTGLVSLAHIVAWTPGLIALLRTIPTTESGSRFGLWCRTVAAVIIVAFVFDLRDAGSYLYHHAVGHPVLEADGAGEGSDT